MNILVRVSFIVFVGYLGPVLSEGDHNIADEFTVDKNVAFIENYAKEHTDAIRLPSGVLYRVLKAGAEDGPRVTPDKACTLRYVGTTIAGDMFTSSSKKGTNPSQIVPDSIALSGWREALTLMKEGDHWEVVLPAHLAYGDKFKGKYIKPGATVVFELELHSASGKGMSLFTRQALGLAFMLAYAVYVTYQNKQKVTLASAGPALEPKDVYNSEAAKSHPTVFLKIAVGNEILERVEIELFSSICPKTAENFRCLCTGEKGMCQLPESESRSIPLHLKDSLFHRVIPDFMCQGGDITRRDGTGGQSIYGETFPDEWDKGAVLHSEPYLLSMANCGVDTNGSQFFITTKPVSWLDRKHVVFGRVKSGFEAVKAVDAAGSSSGRTSKLVRIIDCGEVKIEKCT